MRAAACAHACGCGCGGAPTAAATGRLLDRFTRERARAIFRRSPNVGKTRRARPARAFRVSRVSPPPSPLPLSPSRRGTENSRVSRVQSIAVTLIEMPGGGIGVGTRALECARACRITVY